MATSSIRLERLTDSLAEIVKIMMMVLRFHPNMNLASLIFQEIQIMRLLVDNFFAQTRAFWDWISKKIENKCEALQTHLAKEAANGYPISGITSVFISFSVRYIIPKTEMTSIHDTKGTETELFFIFSCGLWLYSTELSRLPLFRKKCGFMFNAIANLAWFITTMLLSKFYGNSLWNLVLAFAMAVYFLSLLIVLRPRSDLGFFGFIMGGIGSVTYNLFGLKFESWVIATICFFLMSFKSWLDRYWFDSDLDIHHSESTRGAVLFPNCLTLPVLGMLFILTGIRFGFALLQSLDFWWKYAACWVSTVISNKLPSIQLEYLHLFMIGILSTKTIQEYLPPNHESSNTNGWFVLNSFRILWPLLLTSWLLLISDNDYNRNNTDKKALLSMLFCYAWLNLAV